MIVGWWVWLTCFLVVGFEFGGCFIEVFSFFLHLFEWVVGVVGLWFCLCGLLDGLVFWFDLFVSDWGGLGLDVG